MNKNTINYITNVIGLAVISLAFYEYFSDKDKTWFILLNVLGFALLTIENKSIQNILKSIIGVKTQEKQKTLDPDRDSPDDRG